MRSMTGYGRGQASATGLAVTVEVRSVNGRQREIRLRLPGELSAREPALRARVQEAIARGRIEVHAALERSEGRPVTLRCNRTVARAALEAAGDLRRELGLEGPLELPELLSLPGVLELVPAASEEEADRVVDAVSRALDEALDAHLSARRAEGARLLADLSERLETARSLRDEMAALAPEATTRAAERLRQRIEDLVDGVALDEARLAQEVAYLADRSDITEELVRLRSHLDEAGQALAAAGEEPVGRRLEFLVQEIQREVTTIGNKTADLRLGKVALALKNEVEKVREQVQNVE